MLLGSIVVAGRPAAPSLRCPFMPLRQHLFIHLGGVLTVGVAPSLPGVAPRGRSRVGVIAC